MTNPPYTGPSSIGFNILRFSGQLQEKNCLLSFLLQAYVEGIKSAKSYVVEAYSLPFFPVNSYIKSRPALRHALYQSLSGVIKSIL